MGACGLWNFRFHLVTNMDMQIPSIPAVNSGENIGHLGSVPAILTKNDLLMQFRIGKEQEDAYTEVLKLHDLVLTILITTPSHIFC